MRVCSKCGRSHYREVVRGLEVTFDVFVRADGDIVSHIVEYEPGGFTVHEECNNCGHTMFEDAPDINNMLADILDETT